MSFSGDVREELMRSLPNARHCRIAELAAMCLFAGKVDAEGALSVSDEDIRVPEKAVQLIKKLFKFEREYEPKSTGKITGKDVYSVRFDPQETEDIFKTLKLSSSGEVIRLNNSTVYSQTCCKRAFIRGAFMAAGNLSDPEKDYHFEIASDDLKNAESVASIISFFNIDAKIIARKKYHVVYIKDSEAIVDLLNIMEAHVALMQVENIRILKEMRNSVNRRVNCEAANIGKTIVAAGKQIEDITFIRDTVGLDVLSDDLRATAELRLQYPDDSLSELGRLHDKPLGRSGVNHRLVKLSEMAERLRSGKPL